MLFDSRVSGAHHNAIAQDLRDQGLGNELGFLFSLSFRSVGPTIA